MKNLLSFLLTIAMLPLFGQVTTPAASPSCKLEQKVGLGTVTVEYSRPSMKNRKIFGDGPNPVVSYGKIWRTGANAATKITFSDDVTFEGTKVPKG
ncbi:MAG TPA: DUF2911 domain-containing protein, partial [Saprospiraceae bacterium]|nr:DUF2911 domain-containing protein [Saprospiraceae bacterium]